MRTFCWCDDVRKATPMRTVKSYHAIRQQLPVSCFGFPGKQETWRIWCRKHSFELGRDLEPGTQSALLFIGYVESPSGWVLSFGETISALLSPRSWRLTHWSGQVHSIQSQVRMTHLLSRAGVVRRRMPFLRNYPRKSEPYSPCCISNRCLYLKLRNTSDGVSQTPKLKHSVPVKS